MTFADAIAVRTLWGECRGEPPEAQKAVAHVLLNRMRDGRWGEDLGSVCLYARQFSCWNGDDPNRPKMAALHDEDPMLLNLGAVLESAKNESDPTNGALYYYAISMLNPPSWANGMIPCGQFGHHKFFKEK